MLYYMCERKRKLISNRKRLISQTKEKMLFANDQSSMKGKNKLMVFYLLIFQNLLMKAKALFTICDLSDHCAIQ